MKTKTIKVLLPICLVVSVTAVASIAYIYKDNLDKKTQITNNQNLLDLDTANSKDEAQIKKLESYLNDPFLLLCNKNNLLADDFTADEIVPSGLPFLSYIETTDLNKTTATNAKAMFEAAKKDGINLLGASGYRTNAVQTSLFNSRVASLGKEKAMKYSAPPGASEHETGYAIDIVSTEFTSLTSDFENTKAFSWLQENAADYGFIMRYAKDKVDITKYEYEPWHYRYVGKTHAEKIKSSSLTLEEYIESIKSEISTLKESIKTRGV